MFKSNDFVIRVKEFKIYRCYDGTVELCEFVHDDRFDVTDVVCVAVLADEYAAFNEAERICNNMSGLHATADGKMIFYHPYFIYTK